MHMKKDAVNRNVSDSYRFFCGSKEGNGVAMPTHAARRCLAAAAVATEKIRKGTIDANTGTELPVAPNRTANPLHPQQQDRYRRGIRTGNDGSATQARNRHGGPAQE